MRLAAENILFVDKLLVKFLGFLHACSQVMEETVLAVLKIVEPAFFDNLAVLDNHYTGALLNSSKSVCNNN